MVIVKHFLLKSLGVVTLIRNRSRQIWNSVEKPKVLTIIIAATKLFFRKIVSENQETIYQPHLREKFWSFVDFE